MGHLKMYHIKYFGLTVKYKLLQLNASDMVTT